MLPPLARFNPLNQVYVFNESVDYMNEAISLASVLIP